VPQDTGRPQAHRRDAKRMVSTQAHWWCSGAWSVLQRMVGAQAPPSVLRCMVVTQPMVGAHSPLLVPKPIAGPQAHGQCASLLPLRTAQTGPPGAGRAGGAGAMMRPGRWWWEEEDGAGSPGITRCQSRPNKAVERTGKKLALFPSRSPPALGLAAAVVGLSCAPRSEQLVWITCFAVCSSFQHAATFGRRLVACSGEWHHGSVAMRPRNRSRYRVGPLPSPSFCRKRKCCISLRVWR
jgi:hypothetical protein